MNAFASQHTFSQGCGSDRGASTRSCFHRALWLGIWAPTVALPPQEELWQGNNKAFSGGIPLLILFVDPPMILFTFADPVSHLEG